MTAIVAAGSRASCILLLSLVAVKTFVGGEAAAIVSRNLDPLAARAHAATHGVADPAEKVFNVMKFGAKPDGKHDNTQAFQKAWNAACHNPGKTTLLIPRGNFLLGQVIFEGPCSGPHPIVVQIQGTLLAQTDPSEFVSDVWILFEGINGLVVIGGGTLDGQGASVWQYSDCNANPNCQRMPVNVQFNKVTNALMRKIASVNSKGFHVSVTMSNNVRLYNLRITAPDDSPNTDGIHISQSSVVKIANTEIATGDDCIGMIQGSTNITIKKVTCGPGHGISIGSLGKYPNEADVRFVIVKNCTLKGTDNGVRIKSWPGSPPSQASGIFFIDVVLDNVSNPIVIDQEYNSHGKKVVKPSRVKISDVHFVNVRGTTPSPLAVNLVCSKQVPCERIQFHNINLKYTGAAKKARSSCVNVQGLMLGGVQVPPVCR